MHTFFGHKSSLFIQEYMNMVKNYDESKSPSSNEGALAKLRQRLKEKESALEVSIPILWFHQEIYEGTRIVF